MGSIRLEEQLSMYFMILAIIAASVLVVGIPIAIAIALMSPRAGTRLAPERNPGLRGFAITVVIVVFSLLLLAAFSALSSF